MGKEKQIEIEESREEKEESYFFDSTALVNLFEGNTGYLMYSKSPISITLFNLAEVYWVILNKIGEEKAEEAYRLFENAVVKTNGEIIKEAMKFRKAHKNKGFSYADAIGYICAKKNNIKFLTSDSKFEDFENVEFDK